MGTNWFLMTMAVLFTLLGYTMKASALMFAPIVCMITLGIRFMARGQTVIAIMCFCMAGVFMLMFLASSINKKDKQEY